MRLRVKDAEVTAHTKLINPEYTSTVVLLEKGGSVSPSYSLNSVKQVEVSSHVGVHQECVFSVFPSKNRY